MKTVHTRLRVNVWCIGGLETPIVYTTSKSDIFLKDQNNKAGPLKQSWFKYTGLQLLIGASTEHLSTLLFGTIGLLYDEASFFQLDCIVLNRNSF